MAIEAYCSKRECDVFVSGASDDAAKAGEIAEMLKRKGYNVYFAAGGPQRARLAAISRCKDFVAVLGKAGMRALADGASPLAQEVRRAIERERNVIPVSLDGAGAALAALCKTPGLADEICDFAALPVVDAAALTSRLASRPRWSRMSTMLAALVAALAIALGAAMLCRTFSEFPRTGAEREAASRLLAAIESSAATYAGVPGGQVRTLGKTEAAELVRSLDGAGVDQVALAAVLAVPEARRSGLPLWSKDAFERDISKVLSAIHCKEAGECRRRVSKLLEGLK